MTDTKSPLTENDDTSTGALVPSDTATSKIPLTTNYKSARLTLRWETKENLRELREAQAKFLNYDL